jgi:hypothetical protein
MARYSVVWLEVAREQYDGLPGEARDHVDTRLDQLAEDPRQVPRSAYDHLTDQWTTVYGDGAGLILFALVHQPPRVIVLRLVAG